MLKKYIANVMIFTACAILLGHNIIPHHHHESSHDLANHHQTSHHHEGGEESNDLSHLFSHIFHSEDAFTAFSYKNFNHTFSKKLISLVIFFPGNFSLKELLIPTLFHQAPADVLIYISPHSLACGLRAPPAFIF